MRGIEVGTDLFSRRISLCPFLAVGLLVFFSAPAMTADGKGMPSILPVNQSAVAGQRTVVAYSFHGTLRCTTCLLVERGAEGTVSVGAPAPPLVGADIKAVAITAESFKGRPVLVDFGSMFCVFCEQTMKEFARLEKVYKATDLALVMVTDSIASPKVMANTFGGLGATYTVIRDEGSKLFESYGVKIIPFQASHDHPSL
jgi:thiol-disulfide isomerase/thioredoxin